MSTFVIFPQDAMDDEDESRVVAAALKRGDEAQPKLGMGVTIRREAVSDWVLLDEPPPCEYVYLAAPIPHPGDVPRTWHWYDKEGGTAYCTSELVAALLPEG